LGKPFPELYNTSTLEPNSEWMEVYIQVKDQLTGMGLDMEGGWVKALQMPNQ
jgi:hypothetical protein